MGRATRNVSSIRLNHQQEPLTIIIPAAGEGTRMKSYGPKSLIKFRDITLLQYQVNLLHKIFPNSNIITIVGHEAIKVMNNGPKNVVYIENERYSTTNVCRSISIGLRAAKSERVLILYGDLVFNEYLFNITLGDNSVVFIDVNNSMNDTEVGCVVNKGCVTNFAYDLPYKWAQTVYLTGAELKAFSSIVHKPEKEKMFGFEILNELINNDYNLTAFSHPMMRCVDIDSSKDIEKAKAII